MNLLEGVRVLDVTEALAGPYCSAILSDLGAEVIKIERLDGDPMRGRVTAQRDVSIPFEMIQRGKRSVALDFRQLEGAEALMRLAGSSDVVVENFRPGVLAKYGLDSVSMRERFPSLVYCSISGFGQTGPLSEAGGVDLVAQGFAGLMSVTGFAERGPAKAGYPVGDLGSGMWAAIGVIGALHRRQRTGEGCTIDVALTDAIASWSMWEMAEYQMSGAVPGPLGTAHRLTAPYQAFQCRDGRWITIAAVERQWPAFCTLLGVGPLVDDPRFAVESGRFAHREELAEILAGRFRTRDRDQWIDVLREVGVPCGPVHDMQTLLEEPQFRSRGMWVDIDVEGYGVTLVNTPIIADGVPRITAGGPTLGHDTSSYLSEVGYSDEEITSFATRGVINIG